MKRTCACLIVLFVVACAPARAVLPEYVLRDLGDLGFATFTAADINETGQAVFNEAAGGNRFFYWDGNTLEEVVGVAGFGVNDHGQVAATTGQQSYVWDGTSHEVPLNRVLDINNAGQLIGTTNTPYATWLYAAGQLTALGPGIEPLALNNRGQIAGYKRVGETVSYPLIWTAGGGQVMPFRGGAYGINDLGQIVGSADLGDPEGVAHAFYWDGIAAHDIGRGAAYDVNDHGRVVGGFGPSGAGVWEDGQVAKLPDFGVGLYSLAFAVNNSGVIAGIAKAAFGHAHIVLWEPVPEPASLPSLAAGVLSLGLLLRWRRAR